MISKHDYKPAGYRRTYPAAKKRKEELRQEGYRVKIRKALDGSFEIFIKDIVKLDVQEKHGKGGRFNCHL